MQSYRIEKDDDALLSYLQKCYVKFRIVSFDKELLAGVVCKLRTSVIC